MFGDFYNEIVIGIISKVGEIVVRYFILKVNFVDRWLDIVRVKMFFGCDMFEMDFGVGENIFKGKFVLGVRGWFIGGRSVNDLLDVVVVLVGVESDLLFCVW